MPEVRRNKPQIVRWPYGRGCLSETSQRRGGRGAGEARPVRHRAQACEILSQPVQFLLLKDFSPFTCASAIKVLETRNSHQAPQ